MGHQGLGRGLHLATSSWREKRGCRISVLRYTCAMPQKSLYMRKKSYIRPTTMARTALCLFVALVVAGCGSTSQPTRTRQPAVVETETTAEQSPVDGLLAQAARADAVEAAGYFLEAARYLWAEGDIAGTEEILGFIQTEELDSIRMEGIRLLQAEVAAARDDQVRVAALLTVENFPTLERLSDEQRIRFVELRATALAARGDYEEAITERIRLDPRLSPEQQLANHDSLWQVLKSMPVARLGSLAVTREDSEEQGWYRLAQVAMTWSNDLDHQLLEVRRWRADWERHPAARIPPSELALSEIVAQERPQRIAVLLPLQLAPGAIVRDAFMSAYFSLLELGGQVPEVRFYDTGTNVDNIVALHRQARADGAQMVIGPLLKPQVAALQQEADLGVPTLALNNNEGATTNSPQLYQFSLSPENEARQVARKGWDDGHRNVAILSPLDAPGNEVLIRKRESFVAEWQRLGGRVVAQDGYRDNYTETISGMLELDASTARMASLRALIGRPVLFVQRRRQDIDFIYLLAEPAPARQIVPSLAYLYAGDIPVYAGQDVYSGIARPLEDRDLNGVTFAESPWLLGNAGSDNTRLRELFPATTANNLRLQAFGMDAFRLYPRLRLLESSPEARMPGASGTLHLGANRAVESDLVWATVNEGLVQSREP
jgi:outer membrane PBP1 activator LpoA protein